MFIKASNLEMKYRDHSLRAQLTNSKTLLMKDVDIRQPECLGLKMLKTVPKHFSYVLLYP